MNGVNSIFDEMRKARMNALNEEQMNEAYSQKLLDKAEDYRSKVREKKGINDTDYYGSRVASDIMYDRTRTGKAGTADDAVKDASKHYIGDRGRLLDAAAYDDTTSAYYDYDYPAKQKANKRKNHNLAKAIDRHYSKDDKDYAKDRRSQGKKEFFDQADPYYNAERRREKRLASKGVKYEKGTRAYPKNWTRVSLANEEDVNEALDIQKKATNGKAFTVEINGKKYSYYPTEESGLTAKELGQKYTAMAKHSMGRALQWLKKNAITTDSYRKVAAERTDEEVRVPLFSKDNQFTEEELITIAKVLGLSGYDGEDDDAYVAHGNELRLLDWEPYDITAPENDGDIEYARIFKNNDGTFDAFWGDSDIDAEAPIADLSKKDILDAFKNAAKDFDRQYNEDEELSVNEEMTITVDAEDILKAAEQITKAQEEGKQVTVIQSASGFKVEATDSDEPKPDDADDIPKDDSAEEECGASKDEETCPVCGKAHKKGEKCCEEQSQINVNEEIEALKARIQELEAKSNVNEDTANEEVDVAELATRLDECEGSDYMKKALADGKTDLVKKYLFLKEDK